jgi:hypothetical protein
MRVDHEADEIQLIYKYWESRSRDAPRLRVEYVRADVRYAFLLFLAYSYHL